MSTSIVTATRDQPAYCDVMGLIAPQIQFELRLAIAGWNGRYLQVGCGGYCGTLQAGEECQVALGRNFAVGFDNTGRVGGMGGNSSDALWARNQPQLRRDFGYHSEHVMALAAKAIITAFYGSGPAHAYYQGCSNGGRQALQEAQRWPDDFDGIIAGAPAAIQAPLNGEYEVWNGRVNQDASGKPILTADKLRLIHIAALAACDGNDGLVDGQITDPRACTYDPATLRCTTAANTKDCLTDAQIAVVRQLYAGPSDAQGRHLYPGHKAIGSELAWEGWVVGTGDMPPQAAGSGDGYLKYLAFEQSPPPTFSINDWQFTDTGFNNLRPLGDVYNATNPDLSAFGNRGGKLILYHGWADPAIPPYGTIADYQAVQDTMGGLAAVQQFARLFMVPGMYHCGGTGPSNFDMLTPIVA